MREVGFDQEERIFVVIVGRREKYCGKMALSVGGEGVWRPQGVWMFYGLIHGRGGKVCTFHTGFSTFPLFSVDLRKSWMVVYSYLALMLALMSLMISATSGLVFISFSTRSMECMTVA